MLLVPNPINLLSSLNFNAGKSFLFVLTSFCIIHCSYSQRTPAAIRGVLDLQNRQWAKNGLADLNGEWEFYWDTLFVPSSSITSIRPTAYAIVPGFWNAVVPDKNIFKPAFGYATYRLHILCPPSREQLKLKLLTVASAYTLFVNGQQVAAVGKTGTSATSAIPAFQPLVVPVTPVNDQLDIVVQVSNFTYSTGGLWDFIKLGTAQQVDEYRIRNIAIDFFITGSFFLIGLFYLVIYFFFSRRRSPLYFAIFCMLIGIRPLVTGELGIEYITHWSWQLTKHIEFISLYLTVPVLSLFTFDLFREEFSKKVLQYILILSVPFIAVALFATPYIFRYTLRPFQVFMLLAAGYGLYAYLCAAKNKRVGSIYFLVGIGLLFIAIVNDILYTSLIINSTNLLYAGLYMLVICQATALSRQFFSAFTKIEKLNEDLEQINEELNQKNETINETNDQLNKLNEELDTLIFRTTHDLKSPITSVFTMAEVIKQEEDAGKRNEYVEFQKKTLSRLNALIAEILDYAKNKSTALQYESIDLKTFIQDALHDHEFAPNAEKIKRIVEVNQEGIFTTDKARLGMVMSNLISNGLKHHNVVQESPYLKIIVQATTKEAVIEVIDNGPGIAQNHADHIFNKFYRANTKLGGSGFGLYIVKEAVAKLSGTIEVESQLHAGTRFCIKIPNGQFVKYPSEDSSLLLSHKQY